MQHRDIIVVGTSAGGVPALQKLVAAFPRDLPASVFIVMHIGAQSRLGAVLAPKTDLPVLSPVNRTPIERGKIYVAPPDYHMLLEDGTILMVRGPKENRNRPAINVLFRSAAIAFGPRVIGVILTGLLDDGTSGLWAIKRSGGTTIVQADPEFDQMANSAREYVDIDYEAPLSEIGPLIVKLCADPPRYPLEGQPPEVARLRNEKAKMNDIAIDLDKVGERTCLTCPECGGALWQFAEGQLPGFGCHVGHSYSAAGLDEAQQIALEEIRWGAIRSLKENAALNEIIGASLKAHGKTQAGEFHVQKARESQIEAERLQELLGAQRPLVDQTTENPRSVD